MEKDFSELQGQIIKAIEVEGDVIKIATADGRLYQMYHDQCCCERVRVEDVIGDLNDLIDTPITMAEKVSYCGENPDGVPHKDYQDSWTWTFYKLATIKGYVTIRWYGASNGYYSESVTFEEIEQ